MNPGLKDLDQKVLKTEEEEEEEGWQASGDSEEK